MLAGLTPERFIRRRKEILAMSDAIAAAWRWWLATLAGSPVGFVEAGRSRDEDPPANAELYALHVLPAAHRRGIGRALLATALPYLRTLDERGAFLWVLEGNLNARAFYEHAGWTEDGAIRTFESGPKIVTELRYRHPFR
jgi:ribosomal protein S18 acetylase RimI-like enzyme